MLVLGMANARVFNPNAGRVLRAGGDRHGRVLPADRRAVRVPRQQHVRRDVRRRSTPGSCSTTALILRWFAGDIITLAGALAFGDAFGSWLLLWGVFTVLLSLGAYYINLPAFLAFVLLAAAYFVLGFANIMNPSDTVTFLTKLGGWVLIADGICAWYLSWAASLNSLVPDKLPLWPYPYAKAEAAAPPMQTPAVTA